MNIQNTTDNNNKDDIRYIHIFSFCMQKYSDLGILHKPHIESNRWTWYPRASHDWKVQTMFAFRLNCGVAFWECTFDESNRCSFWGLGSLLCVWWVTLLPVHRCDTCALSSSCPQKEHSFGDWFCLGPILTSQTSRFHAKTIPSTPLPEVFQRPPQKKIDGEIPSSESQVKQPTFSHFSGEKTTPHFQGKKLHGDTHAHHFQVNQPTVKPHWV